MKILITNDDGYNAQGIQVLVGIAKRYGDVTVIAPKYHQSGMATAVTMGFKPIAHKDLGVVDGVHWMYIDASPASCVKFATSIVFPNPEDRPDLVLCGINHGSNAGAASCYSGTLGAAEEAAICDIPAIGVSLDNMHSVADFSPVEAYFPAILEKIIDDPGSKVGAFYNINFPAIPVDEVKGVRVCHQGLSHWVREYQLWDPTIFAHYGIDHTRFGLKSPEVHGEEGETIYMMVGENVDDPRNTEGADHQMLAKGYITITMHNINTTDEQECDRLRAAGFEKDFK